MATKTAAKKPATKKATTTKTTKKTASAKSTKKNLSVGILTENRPEEHVATGKYKFFFAFFALTTVMFAAICVWLFVFSSEILNKWESLKTCARNDTCVIEYVEKNENKDGDVVVDEEADDGTVEE